DGGMWRLSPIFVGGETASDEHLVLFATPYPWRLYTLFGPEEREFTIHEIRGCPPGWRCDVPWPGLNRPFRVPALDRNRMGVLRLLLPAVIPEETEFTLEIVQTVVGKPLETPFLMRTRVRFLALERPYDALRTNSPRGVLAFIPQSPEPSL